VARPRPSGYRLAVPPARSELLVLPAPDPRTGIVAVGGDLEPESLLAAYRRGVFPWPVEGMPLLWFCPAERAVLDVAGFHLSRSLRRARRTTTFRFSLDAAFADVIRGCAETPRRGQEGTWITPEIIAAYVRLHGMGIAHSVEVWRHARLVGGVYGVDVDGVFAAESMFHREPNASKLALAHLVERLGARGGEWIDVQVMTPHLARLGARPIARDAFLARLAATRRRGLKLFGA
jgi:leucyl/phenylalanyl-tRNA--protein transferase